MTESCLVICYDVAMKIDTETKLIARMHTDNNGTGLDIYNPYFEEAGINAVYMLFRNDSAEPLVEGLRNLQLSGAIAAGFEHDANLLNLVDDSSEAAKVAGRIGIITNWDGVLRAHYQGGEGLQAAIAEKYDITGKRVVIVGAGTVAKTLVLALSNSTSKPSEIIICNRTLDTAQAIKDQFNNVTTVRSLEDLGEVSGDLLVNASRVGSTAEDTFYTQGVIDKYQAVADVTFGTENTNLIALARQADLSIVSGWDMFTHQASVVLLEILGHRANINVLRKHVRNGLGKTNHGAKRR